MTTMTKRATITMMMTVEVADADLIPQQTAGCTQFDEQSMTKAGRQGHVSTQLRVFVPTVHPSPRQPTTRKCTPNLRPAHSNHKEVDGRLNSKSGWMAVHPPSCGQPTGSVALPPTLRAARRAQHSRGCGVRGTPRWGGGGVGAAVCPPRDDLRPGVLLMTPHPYTSATAPSTTAPCADHLGWAHRPTRLRLQTVPT